MNTSTWRQRLKKVKTRAAWPKASRILGKSSSRAKITTPRNSRRLRSHWYRVSTLEKNKRSSSQDRITSMISQWNSKSQKKVASLLQLKICLKSRSQLRVFLRNRSQLKIWSKNKSLCMKSKKQRLLKICSMILMIRKLCLKSLRKILSLTKRLRKQIQRHHSLISQWNSHLSLYNSL